MAHNESASRHDRGLGVPAIALMIIAASAPLTVIGGGATTAYTVTESIAVPIGYIVLTIGLSLFAVGYAAMSRYISNAGAFYSYAAQGLGRPVGLGVSIIALVTYNCMQIGLYGLLGFQVAEYLGYAVPWWSVAVGFVVIVGVFGVNRLDLSAKVLGLLVALEFVLVAIFDFAAFQNPAEHVTAQPILPSELFTPGIGAVLVFGVAAFMGFEQAAIYSEEAKDPKRTVARATFAAVWVIGLFYAFSSWALALAVGPERIVSGGIAADDAGPPLFFNFVAAHLGTFMTDLMSVLFITSVFAAVLSFHNAIARYVFSLGREGILPPILGRRGANGVPWAGSLAQSALAIVVIAGFAIAGSNSELGRLYPVVTLFNWLTNTGAMGLVLLMMLISLAVIGYFRQEKRDTGWWSRLIAPLIAFVVLAVIYYQIFENFNVLLGQEQASAATYILPLLLIVPGLIGVAWGLALKHICPDVYARIGQGGSDQI